MSATNPTPDPLSPGREAEIREWRDELGARKDFAAVGPYTALNDALAEVDRLRSELSARVEDIGFLERNTLPDLHRQVEHHKAGKQRWRDRAEKAEAEVTRLRAELNVERTWYRHKTRGERAQAARADSAVQQLRGLRGRFADLFAEVELTAERLNRAVQACARYRQQNAQLGAERDELKKRVTELDGRLHDAAMTKTWTNEDGKKFVFVEDIAPALLGLPDSSNLRVEDDASEYGIRTPDGEVLLSGDTFDRRDQEARLARCRDSWPSAVLVQRTVRYGEWTEAE